MNDAQAEPYEPGMDGVPESTIPVKTGFASKQEPTARDGEGGSSTDPPPPDKTGYPLRQPKA